MVAFAGFSPGEKRLTAEALILLVYVRTALLFLPPGAVRAPLKVLESRACRRPYPPEMAVRAVERVAGRLKALDNCLAKALAARTLLARSGHAVRLRVGLIPGIPRLDAHAWLERDGAVILGGAEQSAKYVPFPELERALL